MNWEIRDGARNEAREVKLCKRATRLPHHIDCDGSLASVRSLQPVPVTGLAADTDLYQTAYSESLLY